MTWLDEVLSGTRRFVDTDVSCCLCEIELSLSVYETGSKHRAILECDYDCPANRCDSLVISEEVPSRKDIADLFDGRNSLIRELSESLSDHAAEITTLICDMGREP